MTITLFAILCSTAAAVFIFSLTSVSRNPVAAFPNSHGQQGPKRPLGVGLTKSQAEELLDWLEANGRKGKLTFVSGKGFSVC
jgi:hypothetical protein